MVGRLVMFSGWVMVVGDLCWRNCGFQLIMKNKSKILKRFLVTQKNKFEA